MLNTIKQIEENKIIVIVRGVAKEKLIPLAEAMYAGGIRIMECTYDATGKMPDEENAANIAMLAEHFGDRMVVGAGTVLTEKQVRLTKEAGGKFIISPDTNEAIIKESKAQGLVSIPGAITPSEAAAASRAGADFVKTSTGFSTGGATAADVKLMKDTVGDACLVKAAGGVRNKAQFLEMISLGADRIGTSSGTKLL